VTVADSTRQACVGVTGTSALTGLLWVGAEPGAVNCGQVDTEMGCGVEGHAGQRGKAEGAENVRGGTDATVPWVAGSGYVLLPAGCGKQRNVSASPRKAMTRSVQETNGQPEHPAGIKPGHPISVSAVRCLEAPGAGSMEG